MNRAEFRALAQVRLVEADRLLNEGLYDGAYYLSGYAVECALKACIARQTQRYDFPPKVADVRDMYTHDLERLVRLAGLDADRLSRIQACPVFAQHWLIVREWSEESRYARWTDDAARSIVSAIADRRHGILRWLRKHW